MNKWVCCQLGARMHYAVPRFLHACGALERLHTDIYAGGGWSGFGGIPRTLLPPGFRRFAGRAATGLPAELVKSYPAFGLLYYLRRQKTSDHEAMDRAHLWAGERFCRKVVHSGFGGATAVYTYNTAGLEVLEAARQKGLFAVVEQTIAPRAIEEQLIAAAHERFPGWEPDRAANKVAAELAERETAEWRHADLIVCGSEFVRDGIGQCGGPVERCVVVPYGVDAPRMPGPRDVTDSGVKRPLRVLIAGLVGLRKGVGDVLAVAKELGNTAQLRWAGAVSVCEPARSELAARVDLAGAVPRSEIGRLFQWADVFFLPSICEGSATVTYEALASGLPVVTTSNAGSVVRHGVDGFISPVHDTAAMAGYLRRFHEDRELLAEFSRAAGQRSEYISLAGYRDRFLAEVARVSKLSRSTFC